MPSKLYVGNLSFQATDADLQEFFEQAGAVVSARVIMDRFTNRPRGFGFVEMATFEEGQKAIQMLNGRVFKDRPLIVNEARGPGGTRGGGGDRGPRGPRGPHGGRG
jgi:cold-inducible RNA-binding protein